MKVSLLSALLTFFNVFIATSQACDFNAPSAQGASWSPDGKRIAYSSNVDGNWEIYLIAPDGTNRARVTFSEDSDDYFPYFSPDGSKLTYVGFRKEYKVAVIYIYDLVDREHVVITNEEEFNSDPHWSPDGQMITYFSRDNEGNEDIFIMQADGTNNQRLTNNKAKDYNPKWSPDGGSIFFVSNREMGKDDIFRYHIESRQVMNVTQDSVLNFHPGISSDMASLLFAHRQYVPANDWEKLGDEALNNMEIWKMDFDEPKTRYNLTRNSYFEGDANWSPDDSKVVFTSCQTGIREIFIMPIPGVIISGK